MKQPSLKVSNIFQNLSFTFTKLFFNRLIGNILHQWLVLHTDCIYSLNMLFTSFMMLKYIFIIKGFIACNTMKIIWWLTLISFNLNINLFSIDSLNDVFPIEQATLFPLLIKGLISLLFYDFPIKQRISLDEKLFHVFYCRI